MIVKVDETNNDELYQPRLTKVSQKLLEIFNSSNEEQKENVFGDDQPTVEDLTFNTIEGYYRNIEYIMNLGGRYLYMPLNEEPFQINLDTRAIITPDHFKKNGVAVAGDNKAEILYFLVDRYYDIVDLYQTSIGIKWTLIPDDKTKEIQQGISEAFCPDPSLSLDLNLGSDKIIFGWVIHKNLTKYAGKIKFSIIFVNKDASLANAVAADYTLNTLENTVVVNNTLQLTDENIQVDATNSANLFKTFLKNTVYSGDEISIITPEFIIVPEELENLDNSASHKFMAKALAYSSSLGSELTYKWQALNPATESTGELQWVELSQEEYEQIDIQKNIYYIKENNSYKKASQQDRINAKSDKGATEDKKLYLNITTWEITDPGTYSISAQAITDNGKYKSNVATRTFKIPNAYKVTAIDYNLLAGEENLAEQRIYFDNNGNIQLSIKPTQLTGDAYALNQTNVINITENMTNYEKSFIGQFSGDNIAVNTDTQELIYTLNANSVHDEDNCSIIINHTKNTTTAESSVLKSFQCYHKPSIMTADTFTETKNFPADSSGSDILWNITLNDALPYCDTLSWVCNNKGVVTSGTLSNTKDATLQLSFSLVDGVSAVITFTNLYAGNTESYTMSLVPTSN